MHWPRTGDRRSLGDLDANAPAAPRMVPGAYPTRTNPHRKEPAMTAPTRPAPPVHIDPAVLAEVSKKLGMPAREIINVVDSDAGRIVTTHDGNKIIIVPADRPDALGQTGPLIYQAPANVRAPRYAAPGVVTVGRPSTDPWTIDDLDLAATREYVPSQQNTATGPSRMPWVGRDPVKARAVWLRIATDSGLEPNIAVRHSNDASACRSVILASGWLAADEAAKL